MDAGKLELLISLFIIIISTYKKKYLLIFCGCELSIKAEVLKLYLAITTTSVKDKEITIINCI